jgi:hypothetical protein
VIDRDALVVHSFGGQSIECTHEGRRGTYGFHHTSSDALMASAVADQERSAEYARRARRTAALAAEAARRERAAEDRRKVDRERRRQHRLESRPSWMA